MPKIITPLKKAEVIAQRELGFTQRRIAKNTDLCKDTVCDIIHKWSQEKEKEDFLPYIGQIKKRLAQEYFNNAAHCVNLTTEDIYNKSTPFQRVTMSAIMVDKGLLLLGQATQIVAYEDVDEDNRARYLRLLQERMRTIDVTPTSPQTPRIASASPTIAPQDTPEPSPKPLQAPESQPEPTASPTAQQWERLQAKPKR